MTAKIQVKLNRDKSPSRGDAQSYRERSPLKTDPKDEKRTKGDEKDEDTQKEPRGRSRVRTEPEPSHSEAKDTDLDPEQDQSMLEMQKLMGFGGFGSTKNKKVEGTNVYGASQNKKAEYRQYMNREKGFNRSLSPTASEKKNKSRTSK